MKPVCRVQSDVSTSETKCNDCSFDCKRERERQREREREQEQERDQDPNSIEVVPPNSQRSQMEGWLFPLLSSSVHILPVWLRGHTRPRCGMVRRCGKNLEVPGLRGPELLFPLPEFLLCFPRSHFWPPLSWGCYFRNSLFPFLALSRQLRSYSTKNKKPSLAQCSPSSYMFLMRSWGLSNDIFLTISIAKQTYYKVDSLSAMSFFSFKNLLDWDNFKLNKKVAK